MIRARTGASRSGPGFRTIVMRYLSVVLGRLEVRFEWTTRASIELKRASDAYFNLKRRAERCLSEDAFDDLVFDLDEHWGDRASTHASASALILQRMKEHQCAAS